MYLMILEIFIYVTVIGLVVWKRQLLKQYAVHLACLLIFMQSVPLAKPVAKELISMRTKVAARHLLGFKTTPKMYEIAKEEVTPKCPDAEPLLDPNVRAWKQYDITYDGFFDYSPKKNVVLIIPDSFGSRLFQRMIKIHPAISEWFSDFNYFTKQKSKDGGTFVNVPQLLTGCSNEFLHALHKNHANPHKRAETILSIWNAEGSQQKTLMESGFQTKVYAAWPSCQHWDHRWISNIRLKASAQNLLLARTLWDDLIEMGIGQMIDLAVVRLLPIVGKPANIEHFHPVQHYLQMRWASKSAKAEFKPMHDKELSANNFGISTRNKHGFQATVHQYAGLICGRFLRPMMYHSCKS